MGFPREAPEIIKELWFWYVLWAKAGEAEGYNLKSDWDKQKPGGLSG
jgi:hypothetical protein